MPLRCLTPAASSNIWHNLKYLSRTSCACAEIACTPKKRSNRLSDAKNKKTQCMQRCILALLHTAPWYRDRLKPTLTRVVCMAKSQGQCSRLNWNTVIQNRADPLPAGVCMQSDGKHTHVASLLHAASLAGTVNALISMTHMLAGQFLHVPAASQTAQPAKRPMKQKDQKRREMRTTDC